MIFSNSILFFNKSLSSFSASAGFDLSSIRFLLAASSIKSIALSGNFLLVIYLADSLEAETTASSEILIP